MNYKVELDLFRTTRQNTFDLAKTLTLDQINKIPDGFTGNIAWHLGHMVATHKGLVYQLNGLQGGFEKEFVLKYKKGSVPEGPVDQAELDFILDHMISQIDELENDLNNEAQWGDTHEYSTSYRFTIHSLEEAIKFSNLHQALHLGYIMALRRIVTR